MKLPSHASACTLHLTQTIVSEIDCRRLPMLIDAIDDVGIIMNIIKALIRVGSHILGGVRLIESYLAYQKGNISVKTAGVSPDLPAPSASLRSVMNVCGPLRVCSPLCNRFIGICSSKNSKEINRSGGVYARDTYEKDQPNTGLGVQPPHATRWHGGEADRNFSKAWTQHDLKIGSFRQTGSEVLAVSLELSVATLAYRLLSPCQDAI